MRKLQSAAFVQYLGHIQRGWHDQKRLAGGRAVRCVHFAGTLIAELVAIGHVLRGLTNSTQPESAAALIALMATADKAALRLTCGFEA